MESAGGIFKTVFCKKLKVIVALEQYDLRVSKSDQENSSLEQSGNIFFFLHVGFASCCVYIN
jgi:hypothetical protein